jgi:hypothetical protein
MNELWGYIYREKRNMFTRLDVPLRTANHHACHVYKKNKRSEK